MKRAAFYLSLLLAACRGQISSESPIVFEDQLAHQPKVTPQGESPKKENGQPLFADNRVARPREEGTIPVGFLHEDESYYQGKIGDSYITKSPIQVDEKILKRGEERFNIYCSVCHDRTGSGDGLVPKRGFPKPVSLTADHAIGLSDGELFNIISHGVRNMPGYQAQIPVTDRWAIVVWLRVLQRSQHTTVADVPQDFTSKIEPENAP